MISEISSMTSKSSQSCVCVYAPQNRELPWFRFCRFGSTLLLARIVKRDWVIQEEETSPWFELWPCAGMPSPMPMRAWRQESLAGSCYSIPTMAILQGGCSFTRGGFPPFLPLKIESLDFGDGSGSFILTSSGSAPGSGSTRNKKRFAKFSTALQYLVLQEISEETEQ